MDQLPSCVLSVLSNRSDDSCGPSTDRHWVPAGIGSVPRCATAATGRGDAKSTCWLRTGFPWNVIISNNLLGGLMKMNFMTFH